MLHTSASSFRTIVNYQTFIGVEPLSHPQRLLSVFFVSSLDRVLLTKNLVSPLPSNVCTGGLSPSYVPLPPWGAPQSLKYLPQLSLLLCKSNAVEFAEVSAEDIEEKLTDKEEDFVMSRCMVIPHLTHISYSHSHLCPPPVDRTHPRADARPLQPSRGLSSIQI